MSEFLNILKTRPLLTDGAMGSYLFERTGRLSEMNHVYEALNVRNPDLIREVHFAYLQAGARCLTTNTFGANPTHLDPLGEGGRVAELNRAGVRRAREAIEAFREQTGIEGPFFILGSIGPTLAVRESPQEVRDAYREQVDALVSEGADALLLETFTSLPHVMVLLELMREFENLPPVVVQMSLHLDRSGDRWDQDPRMFVQTVADMGAQVAGVNCCAPWEASAFLNAVHDLEAVSGGRILLTAMPNAGGMQRISHRYMTRVNPEYMGQLARTFVERGVRLVGGCCEVHPRHIAEMSAYLLGRQTRGAATVRAPVDGRRPAGDDMKKRNGTFSRKIKEGEFAVSVEMVPPRGTAPRTLQAKIDFVAELAASGLADAVDITDGSRGIPLMPPGDFVSVVRERLGWNPRSGDGIEFIPHFTARDLNAMGMQSRLIGYHARRIHNLVLVTGDPPKMSPTYPRSTAVFDMDSASLIRYIHFYLNAGVDFGGQRLGRHRDPRTHFTIGSGFVPEAVDRQRELDRLQRKIDNGADYIMTQPAFRYEPLDALDPYRAQVAILVGVMVLTSLEHARRVDSIPGVAVPRAIFDRLSAYDRVEDQAKAGREIAVEQIRRVRENGWAGLYLMCPSSHRTTIEVLRESIA